MIVPEDGNVPFGGSWLRQFVLKYKNGESENRALGCTSGWRVGEKNGIDPYCPLFLNLPKVKSTSGRGEQYVFQIRHTN